MARSNNQRFARRHRGIAPRFRRRSSLGLWLVLIAGGGFVGTLAALQLVHAEQAVGADRVPIRVVAPASYPAPSADGFSARFSVCHSGGGRNCVVDGDTFWFAGDQYRIADIDTPETHPARCAEEAALGGAATERLHEWLNDGAFSLESIDRDSDMHGRKLRVVTRGGTSVGSVLVDEGLAQPWEGQRQPWC
jgi:micrococcal nuclease